MNVRPGKKEKRALEKKQSPSEFQHLTSEGGLTSPASGSSATFLAQHGSPLPQYSSKSAGVLEGRHTYEHRALHTERISHPDAMTGPYQEPVSEDNLLLCRSDQPAVPSIHHPGIPWSMMQCNECNNTAALQENTNNDKQGVYLREGEHELGNAFYFGICTARLRACST